MTAPLFVQIGDLRMRAADWSLSGLKLSNLVGDLPEPGEQLEMQLSLPFQGFDINFPASCKVVRRDPDGGMIAVKFTSLGEREAKLMQHFVEDIVRGAMSSVDNTIQRIDVPVTPASIKPDSSPNDAVPICRWPIKTIVMSTAYLMVGLAVFGYAAMLVFANYFSLEVRSAVISAPIENVKAQAEGRVQWTQFEPRDKVGAGDVVLRLFDNKVEREIDLARLAIKERGNELSYLMRRKVDELDKVAAFAQIETKQIAQARLRQENLQQQVETARLFYIRAEHLFQNGHTAATRVEESKRRLVDLEKKLESQKLELETRIKLAEKNIGKRHFTGRDMIGDLERVSAEITRAEGLLELERQRYEIATQHRERLAITAPFTGTLLRLPRLNNGYVKVGETIALFEKSGERNITTFLTQDEILDIALDARVDVYIPATGEIAAAQIVDINRTLGFFRQASRRSQVRLQWRKSKERTAQVILAFVKPERFARNPRYRAGLPVTVNFSRKSGSYFTAFARKQVQHAMEMMPSGGALSDRARGLWDAYKAATNRFVDNVRRHLGMAQRVAADGSVKPERRPRLNTL